MSGSKVYLQVDRVDAATCARAAQASVSDLHEAMGRPDCRLQTMSPAMRPLIEGLRIAGPAVTAACPPVVSINSPIASFEQLIARA